MAERLRVPEAIAAALANRGILTPEQAQDFIYPSPAALHDPFRMNDMETAVARLEKAIRGGERILVVGDYDVDGITGTALLVSFLTGLDARVQYYIPDREKEGYGLSTAVVKKAEKAGYSLILTVDSGISAIDEAEAARESGLSLIITDHHEPQETIPKADAVLNPKRADSSYPFRELAGVGVAFKLACAVGSKFGMSTDDLLERYATFVALGTVGDLVPLLDENRAFVSIGLDRMQTTKNPGLFALLDVSRMGGGGRVDTYNLSFGLVPRINAAGRIWQPRAGVELLLTSEPARASRIARELDTRNRERIREEADIFDQAVQQIKDTGSESAPIILLSRADWHVGIIGIVASRIMERYHRPVVLLSESRREEDVSRSSPEKGRVLQGSARSVKGFDLYDAIRECSDVLLAFGGHAMAAGLRIHEGDVEEFRSRMSELILQRVGDEGFRPSLSIDAVLPLKKINLELLGHCRLMEPCGVGNPRPHFAARGVTVIEGRPCGADGKHLRLKFGQHSVVMDAIGFNLASRWKMDQLRDEQIDLVFSIMEDNYQNRRSVKMNVLDLKETEEK